MRAVCTTSLSKGYPRRLASVLLGGAWLAGCAAGGATDGGAGDACQIGRQIQGEALAEAIAAAPPCETDADCVEMSDGASCERITISLCTIAVQRDVPDLYDVEAVGMRMCEATEGARLGCSISASCAPHGPPVCDAGECVFAEL